MQGDGQMHAEGQGYGGEPMHLRHPRGGRRGAWVHDGFYARFALGFGAFTESLIPESGDDDFDSDDVAAVVGGFSTASEVAFGGTLGRGLVLGGGVYSTSVVSSTLTLDEDEPVVPPDEVAPPQQNLTLVGPFVDWYLNPRRGWHLQGGLGFALLTGVNLDSGRIRARNAAYGGGVMLGAGYEFWAAPSWSVGVLGRFVGALLVEEDDAGRDWLHAVAAFPQLLLTATYH